jgi:hypothetical protein
VTFSGPVAWTAVVMDWTPKMAKVAMTMMRIEVQYGSNDSVWAGADSGRNRRKRLGIIISMRILWRVCQADTILFQAGRRVLIQFLHHAFSQICLAKR